MASNSFNYFSSLKSLKKKLEKSERDTAPAKVQNEPRRKTVKLKSKAAIREELDSVYAISCIWNPYGDGATAVTVK